MTPEFDPDETLTFSAPRKTWTGIMCMASFGAKSAHNAEADCGDIPTILEVTDDQEVVDFFIKVQQAITGVEVKP